MILLSDRKSCEDHESSHFYGSTTPSFWVSDFKIAIMSKTSHAMSKTSSKWKWLSLKVSIFTPIFTCKLIEIQLICHNFQTKPLSLRWCFVYCDPRPKTHILKKKFAQKFENWNPKIFQKKYKSRKIDFKIAITQKLGTVNT